MGVNSAVARNDRRHTQPRIAGPRRKLVTPWEAVVNPTRGARSFRGVKVGLSLWRELENKQLFGASAQPGQKTGVPRIGGSEVERLFRLVTVEIASPSCGVRTTISGISSWLDGEERARDPRSLTWYGTAAGRARPAKRAVRFHSDARVQSIAACQRNLRHNARKPELG